MSFLLPALVIVLVIGVFASLMREGLWSNCISLVNVITAALLATNFFEPLADWLDTQIPSGTYLWDIISLWIIFGVAYLVFRTATDAVSKYRVRFLKPIDMAGGFLFAGWTAWVFACFFMMSLHTAPLSRNFFFEGFQPEERMVFSMAPDRQWLAFVHRVSDQGLRTRSKRVFDEQAEFMPRYASRREKYSRTEGLLVD